MTVSKPVLIGAGLVGLYLLSSKAVGDVGGGGFSGGGGDEPLNGEGVNITFPEIDMSKIWGDQPPTTEWTKKDIYQADPENPFTTSEGLIQTSDLSNWIRAQTGGAPAAPSLNVRPMPYSIHDPVKKADYTHHKSTLPDPIKLGLTPKSGGSSYAWKRAQSIPSTKKTYTWKRAGKLPGY